MQALRGREQTVGENSPDILNAIRWKFSNHGAEFLQLTDEKVVSHEIVAMQSRWYALL